MAPIPSALRRRRRRRQSQVEGPDVVVAIGAKAMLRSWGFSRADVRYAFAASTSVDEVVGHVCVRG